jgi:hypothetical protein
MSEINDALKRARQTTPPEKSDGTKVFNPLPPLRAEKPPAVWGWMIPAFIVVLIVAAIFFIGWAVTHRHAQKIVIVPKPVAPIHPVVETAPTIQPSAMPIPAATPKPTAIPALPKLPKLQGIFYSPTAPTAILDGKTIGVGDQFGDYHVQQISPTAVTLVDAGGEEIKIGMNH